MERKPPALTILTFLTCRERYSRSTQNGDEHVLVDPTVNFFSNRYPMFRQLGFLVEFTNGHGEYVPCLELRDANEEIAGKRNVFKPFPAHDPRAVYSIHGASLVAIMQPGQYSLVLFMNDEEVARRPLWMHVQT
jgi:hypothetical protein